MNDIGFLRTQDIEEVLKAKSLYKERARFVAGGTNVIPDLRGGSLSPSLLIDLSPLKELNHIREEQGIISIGATTPIADVAESEILRKHSPILSAAARGLGNPLTRNRATLGGNLADASPAADMAPPLLALESSVYTMREGKKGRIIPLEHFFLGPNKTALEDDEVIARITFPRPEVSARGGQIKLGLRNAMAISVVSIALMFDMRGSICRKARVALGSVAPIPIRAYKVEETLEGQEINPEIIEECCEIVKNEIHPITDIRASARYRELAASVLLKRVIGDTLVLDCKSSRSNEPSKSPHPPFNKGGLGGFDS